MTPISSFLLACAACTMAYGQCAPGGLVVIVNKANPTDSLSVAQLRKVVMGDIHTWPNQNKVTLIDQSSASTAHKCVLSAVVRMSEAEYHRYLLSAEFRGEEAVSTKLADSGSNAGRMVATAPGSIAVVEASLLPALGTTVKVVRINGKQPGEPGYPL